MANNKISKIVIVGGGTAGWMTAAALVKTVGLNHHSITLVESDQIGTVGVGEATIPMFSLFNNVLGVNEDEFIRETNATFKLGIEFADWKQLGHSYFHPFGFWGVDMEGIHFTHYWLRWQKLGGSLHYTKFNIETEAARLAKFQHPNHDKAPSFLPKTSYAFQFDAGLYANFLSRYAKAKGVVRTEGKITEVFTNADTGHIERLMLANGSVVEGDFFIDCSGFSALLIGKTLASEFTDWSHWLPVNRAWAVPCEKQGPLLPYTRATAREFGWQWRIPLQHRTGNGYVYCDQFISDDNARARLLGALDGKQLAEPKLLKFTTGFRKKSWVGNCLAIGLSSGFLEPLESTSIHLAQVAISKLLTMFPRDYFDSKLLARYNTEMENEYNVVKDFLIAHYKVTEREDTGFWQYVKNMAVPDSLNDRLELFKSRGEILGKQGELFKETNWFAVLAGQGLMPASYHPIADSISKDELQNRLIKIRNGIQQKVDTMPRHEDYLRQAGLIRAQTTGVEQNTM